MTPAFDRRQFIRLSGGAVAVAAFAACDDGGGAARGPSGTLLPEGGDTSLSATTVASTTVSSTTLPSTPSVPPNGAAPFGGRRLVVVQLNGGNDALNTLPPTAARYRELRPTLAIPVDQVVPLDGVSECGLHPSLAGLTGAWSAGRLALVQGIGFEVPNRSHFVSMDRWWHADQLGQPGWLGRVLDTLPTEPTPLFATALGGGAPLLQGDVVQPTTIVTPGAFAWAGVDPAWLEPLGGDEPGSDLYGAARHAFRRTLQAVDQFDASTGADDDDDLPEREGGSTITDGLAVAAQLLVADVGTQLVVVSAGGFDTHANQLPVHAVLLQDLADGLVAFERAMSDAGMTDQVLVVGTSEFGRRVAENASGGCDHGAGGFAFALGSGVDGGLYGGVDLDDLLDGDIRPVIAPQALLTVCLDWLGLEAESVLGERDDGLALLR